jgi:hypothetical protein
VRPREPLLRCGLRACRAPGESATQQRPLPAVGGWAGEPLGSEAVLPRTPGCEDDASGFTPAPGAHNLLPAPGRTGRGGRCPGWPCIARSSSTLSSPLLRLPGGAARLRPAGAAPSTLTTGRRDPQGPRSAHLSPPTGRALAGRDHRAGARRAPQHGQASAASPRSAGGCDEPPVDGRALLVALELGRIREVSWAGGVSQPRHHHERERDFMGRSSSGFDPCLRCTRGDQNPEACDRLHARGSYPSSFAIQKTL